MGNYNRDNRSGGERNFSRPNFNHRDSGRPAEMFRTTCSKCGKDCEVPFRPTGDRPVFCSSCFENNKNSDSRSTDFGERQMFDAVCDSCGEKCQVPFRPSGDKPIYCSSCFGDIKTGGNRSREEVKSQPQYNDQLEQLNIKLDKILVLLEPNTFLPAAPAETTKEPAIHIKEETKVVKKKASKKKV